MREPYTQLYLHVVWATWDRLPLITADRQPIVYASLQKQCALLGADVLAIGGIEDHVHVLLRFTPTLEISRRVGRMKGASSRVAEEVSREPFKGQGGYGAFTVSRRGVPVARDYVLNRARRHATGSLIRALEVTSLEKSSPRSPAPEH